MSREDFDEWQIGTCVRALEYVVEISDRLVGVNQENELEFPHRADLRDALQDNRFWQTEQAQILRLSSGVHLQMTPRAALTPPNRESRSQSRDMAFSMDASGAPAGA
jgi:hypothetical protein